ncbi:MULTISPECIES: hypothetical protein [unclassified Sphingomonas]|uniref:hypothetical protein n=1 Tax=unclassified Sphingomonas TaxID=196159 RepID=UPI000BC9E019|nr:MAG: hypothetical protein B7Z43_01145 [Sphingomonas sp. 12-62-6]OYX40528.1 MAG: hypothetical protein B7Y98_01305 [Sphingomonas sp. 32-62-10]OYY66926.1 MAG: hypothetical protein B7Y49_01450 [Sphingomonas sp. 28-62-11]
MELLLILSALLSALTGAVANGRAPEVRLHQTVSSTRLLAVGSSTARHRPVHHAAPTLPARLGVAAAPVIAVTRPLAFAPIYMGRRRE